MFRLLFTFGFLSLLILPALSVRMERNAFLNRPITGPAQLKAQLKHDSMVALRYRKHYGMPPALLNTYFATLTPGKLPREMVLPVYFYRPDGTAGFHRRRMQAGRRVLFDRKGRVAMIESCGNPAVHPDQVRKEMRSKRTPKLQPELEVMTPISESETEAPVEAQDIYEGMETDVLESLILEPQMPEELPVLEAPALPSPAIPSTGLGLPLLLTGGIMLSADGSTNTRVTPVPEPASAVVLLGGLGVLARMRKRHSSAK
jgi:hypothetical protein